MEVKFYGFTLEDLHPTAFQLAIKDCVDLASKQGEAGRAWVDLFVDTLYLRKPCETSFSLALGFNKETAGAFFPVVRRILCQTQVSG